MAASTKAEGNKQVRKKKTTNEQSITVLQFQDFQVQVNDLSMLQQEMKTQH